MSLIHFNQVSLRFSEHALLDEVSFRLEAKQKIALIGRNGVGKSTLLALIAGEIEADSGTIERNTDRIGVMPQSIPATLEGSVEDYVTGHVLSTESWQRAHQVSKVISQLELDPEQRLADLSGGQVRRCLLAAALVNEPEILLLDEPTNHLDVTSIEWLESFLRRAPITVVVISHDRVFLQAVCQRFIELERGAISDWQGDYAGFLQYRQQQLSAEVKSRAEFDKKLAQEEVWIRQGIKARRTRNEGRVRALQQLRQQYAERRQRQGQMKLTQQQTQYAGKQVLLAQNLCYRYGDQLIIEDFSCLLQRQDKVGIIGPNGCGKTTLIQCLLGELAPTSGDVKTGTQIQAAYFDQHRQQLNQDQTPIDVVGQGRQSVNINGKEKHVISYLQDFLFTPEQARAKITKLSGGERNRLLLAKLFSQPANLLVLDEPTNDLDIESLELLEDYLLQFDGTLLLISHDRALLNHVVTSTIVFEGEGLLTEYIGGYDDAVRQQAAAPPAAIKTSQPSLSSSQQTTQSQSISTLSYDERRELSRLPAQIEKVEANIAAMHDQMAAPDFYQQSKEMVVDLQSQLALAEERLTTSYARWEQLVEKENDAAK